MSTIELRQRFLNYYRKNEHKFMKPSKIYNDDPTLFFVNSGMCQLKDVFLNKKQYDSDHTKLMNSQICIRAGGKHNDLEEVGNDGYHLTCFEMLGNWSMKNLNKEESINTAYKFLVNECKLNPDNIYATYYEGDVDLCLPSDNETKQVWQKYLPDNKIIASKYRDNFWSMGDEGPCGPCTEIHYDLVGGRDASELVNKSDPEVIEIWNLVFIQYNKVNKEYIPLENTFLDCGAGLERITMVMQKKKSIYETDAMRRIFGYAQALTNSDFYTNLYTENSKIDKAYRIFADHIRTTTIALYHGVDFDCNKRGHIVRKIFRRLLTYMYLYLNDYTITQKFTSPLISSMVSDLLNYWLEYKHDSKIICDKMIKEEKKYVDSLNGLKIKYNKYVKKYGDIELVKDKLKKINGIDSEIIDNIEKIKYRSG